MNWVLGLLLILLASVAILLVIAVIGIKWDQEVLGLTPQQIQAAIARRAAQKLAMGAFVLFMGALCIVMALIAFVSSLNEGARFDNFDTIRFAAGLAFILVLGVGLFCKGISVVQSQLKETKPLAGNTPLWVVGITLIVLGPVYGFMRSEITSPGALGVMGIGLVLLLFGLQHRRHREEKEMANRAAGDV